ncbi:MAG: hypothetical protein U1F43_26980 [Myxococcota bacterium]
MRAGWLAASVVVVLASGTMAAAGPVDPRCLEPAPEGLGEPRLGFLDRTPQPPRARRAAEAGDLLACRGGDGHACADWIASAAVPHIDALIEGPVGDPTVERRLVTACAAAPVATCRALGELVAEEARGLASYEGMRYAGRALMHENAAPVIDACDVGGGADCRALARMFFQGELGAGTPRDLARGDADCRRGVASACLWLAAQQDGAEDAAGAASARARAEDALTAGCGGGDAKACLGRADLAVDEADQRSWRERACALGGPALCAEILLAGSEAPGAAAWPALDAGCAAGSLAACDAAASLRRAVGDGAQAARRLRAEVAARACEAAPDLERCARGGAVLDAHDAPAAAAWFARACAGRGAECLRAGALEADRLGSDVAHGLLEAACGDSYWACMLTAQDLGGGPRAGLVEAFLARAWDGAGAACDAGDAIACQLATTLADVGCGRARDAEAAARWARKRCAVLGPDCE